MHTISHTNTQWTEQGTKAYTTEHKIYTKDQIRVILFPCAQYEFSIFFAGCSVCDAPKITEINHSRCLLVTFFHSILHHQLWPKSHCAMMDALINWEEFVGKKETALFVIRFILFIKIFRKLWKISHHGHNSHPLLRLQILFLFFLSWNFAKVFGERKIFHFLCSWTKIKSTINDEW